MAQDLQSQSAEAEGDEGRLRAAVQTISKSPELRSLLRHWLRQACLLPHVTPYVPGDALETARVCGVQQAGLAIVATLNEHDPQLWPVLQLEEALSHE